MTKLSVLLIFSQANGLLTPDEVCQELQPSPDRRSMYSYLARLKRQGLLERGPNLGGITWGPGTNNCAETLQGAFAPDSRV